MYLWNRFIGISGHPEKDKNLQDTQWYGGSYDAVLNAVGQKNKKTQCILYVIYTTA